MRKYNVVVRFIFKCVIFKFDTFLNRYLHYLMYEGEQLVMLLYLTLAVTQLNCKKSQ